MWVMGHLAAAASWADDHHAPSQLGSLQGSGVDRHFKQVMLCGNTLAGTRHRQWVFTRSKLEQISESWACVVLDKIPPPKTRPIGKLFLISRVYHRISWHRPGSSPWRLFAGVRGSRADSAQQDMPQRALEDLKWRSSGGCRTWHILQELVATHSAKTATCELYNEINYPSAGATMWTQFEFPCSIWPMTSSSTMAGFELCKLDISGKFELTWNHQLRDGRSLRTNWLL